MNTNPSRFHRTLTAGAILGALATISNVYGADEAPAPPQVLVKFADLDVSTLQGGLALYGRIHGAADDVCSRMYPNTVAYRWHKDSCLQKVIAGAVAKVNEPALSAVFASKYGMSAPMVVATAEAR
jgi:UrcA family protein